MVPNLSSNPMLRQDPPALPSTPAASSSDRGLVSTSALSSCASFTSSAASLLSLDRSFTVQGIRCLLDPHPDQFGISRMFGGLLLMAAPVQEVLRVGVAGVGVTAGGVACAATAAAVGVEWTASKAASAAQILTSSAPSSSPNARDEMTRRFISRMLELLRSPDISFKQKDEFKRNPAALVSLNLLTIAFISRHLPGRQIASKESGTVITNETIAPLDSTCKAYFDAICDIKMHFQTLGLNATDDRDWPLFYQKMQQATHGSAARTYEEQKERETVQLLCASADSLSQIVVEDKVFQELWAAATHDL